MRSRRCARPLRVCRPGREGQGPVCVGSARRHARQTRARTGRGACGRSSAGLSANGGGPLRGFSVEDRGQEAGVVAGAPELSLVDDQTAPGRHEARHARAVEAAAVVVPAVARAGESALAFLEYVGQQARVGVVGWVGERETRAPPCSAPCCRQRRRARGSRGRDGRGRVRGAGTSSAPRSLAVLPDRFYGGGALGTGGARIEP